MTRDNGWNEDWLAEYTARQHRSSQKTANLPPVSGEQGKIKATGAAKKKVGPQSKYRNKRFERDGEKWDSEKEYRHWLQLKLREKAGAISNLRRQVTFILAPAVVIEGRKKPALKYLADMVYTEGGREVICDVKSEMTRKLPVYRIKLHLMAVMGLEITEV